MEKPKISIIMPVFNAEEFLETSIKSILNQTFTNFEFIIINDGSTDCSLEIINRLCLIDNRIKIITQENKGIVKSLNLGIKYSKGEFIARMDADDISHPKRLEKQLFYLENNPNIDLISCSYQPIDVHNNNLGPSIIHPSNELSIKIALCFSSPICHPGVMAKRKVFLSHPYKETVSEDHALWISIAKKYSLSNIEEVLLDYRITQNSLSQKNRLRIRLETKTRGFLFFLWLYRNHPRIREQYLDISTYKTINMNFFKFYNGILSRKKR